MLVFHEEGELIRILAKPTAGGGGLQPHGPAVDIGFEHGLAGGRLFAADSNQSPRTTGFNNNSPIVILDPTAGHAAPFISGPPTGCPPHDQPALKAEVSY